MVSLVHDRTGESADPSVHDRTVGQSGNGGEEPLRESARFFEQDRLGAEDVGRGEGSDSGRGRELTGSRPSRGEREITGSRPSQGVERKRGRPVQFDESSSDSEEGSIPFSREKFLEAVRNVPLLSNKKDPLKWLLAYKRYARSRKWSRGNYCHMLPLVWGNRGEGTVQDWFENLSARRRSDPLRLERAFVRKFAQEKVRSFAQEIMRSWQGEGDHCEDWFVRVSRQFKQVREWAPRDMPTEEQFLRSIITRFTDHSLLTSLNQELALDEDSDSSDEGRKGAVNGALSEPRIRYLCKKADRLRRWLEKAKRIQRRKPQELSPPSVLKPPKAMQTRREADMTDYRNVVSRHHVPDRKSQICGFHACSERGCNRGSRCLHAHEDRENVKCAFYADPLQCPHGIFCRRRHQREEYGVWFRDRDSPGLYRFAVWKDFKSQFGRRPSEEAQGRASDDGEGISKGPRAEQRGHKPSSSQPRSIEEVQGENTANFRAQDSGQEDQKVPPDKSLGRSPDCKRPEQNYRTFGGTRRVPTHSGRGVRENVRGFVNTWRHSEGMRGEDRASRIDEEEEKHRESSTYDPEWERGSTSEPRRGVNSISVYSTASEMAVYCPIQVGLASTHALVDCGAWINLANSCFMARVMEKYGRQDIEVVQDRLGVRLAEGTSWALNCRATVRYKVGGEEFRQTFWLSPKLKEDVLLGMPALRSLNASLHIGQACGADFLRLKRSGAEIPLTHSAKGVQTGALSLKPVSTVKSPRGWICTKLGDTKEILGTNDDSITGVVGPASRQGYKCHVRPSHSNQDGEATTFVKQRANEEYRIFAGEGVERFQPEPFRAKEDEQVRDPCYEGPNGTLRLKGCAGSQFSEETHFERAQGGDFSGTACAARVRTEEAGLSIYLHLYTFIHFAICLSIYFSIYPSLYLSIYPSFPDWAQILLARQGRVVLRHMVGAQGLRPYPRTAQASAKMPIPSRPKARDVMVLGGEQSNEQAKGMWFSEVGWNNSHQMHSLYFPFGRGLFKRTDKNQRFYAGEEVARFQPTLFEIDDRGREHLYEGLGESSHPKVLRYHSWKEVTNIFRRKWCRGRCLWLFVSVPWRGIGYTSVCGSSRPMATRVGEIVIGEEAGQGETRRKEGSFVKTHTRRQTPSLC